ncbi:MAG: ABC transporter permease, partial [Thermotogota bacterium]
MKLSEMKDSFKDFWNEFRKEKTGVLGLFLFAIFISIIIFEPFLLPNADANTRWRDITYWEDHPKSAPPVWTDWFSSNKEFRTEEFSEYTMIEKDLGAMKMVDYSFHYEMVYDSGPNDIIIHALSTGNPIIVVKVLRPDGEEIELYQNQYNMGVSGKKIRISIDNNSREKLFNFASKIETSENLEAIKASMTKTTDVIFSKAQNGILRYPEVLKGKYNIQITAIFQNENDTFRNPYIVLPGKVSGVLGTDSQKRDI